MINPFRLRGVWAAVLCFALGVGSLGCGGSGDKNAPMDPTGKDRMNEIVQMLKIVEEDKKKPPAKAADLDAVEPLIPMAVQQLRSGDIVYFWGKGLAEGNAILAHEKKAATDGGWVLLQDGTVKQLSADQFKAAPKAGK